MMSVAVVEKIDELKPEVIVTLGRSAAERCST